MKILILGSSYTLGSYKFVNGEEQWYSHVSWYDRLAEKHQLDVYCGKGLGYVAYVDILESLEPNDYDCCIVQECHEPKFQFTYNETYNKIEFQNITKYVLDENTIIFGKALDHRPALREQIEHNYSVKFNNDMIEYLTKLGKTGSTMNVAKSSACMVNNILEDHNVPGYVICFQQKDQFRYQNKYNKYLNMPTFIDIVDGNENYINVIENTKDQLHLTEIGNKMLADVVHDAFEEMINV